MKNDPTGATGEAMSKFTGPGRYVIESFDCERVVFLDPLPEPQASFLTGWAKMSDDEAARATADGTVWLAPCSIERVVLRKLDDDARDPLLDLIRDYRTQLAIYNASGDLSDEENDALAAVTMDPPWHRLCADCPIPTTIEGAIEAVRLVEQDLREVGTGGFQRSVLAAAVSYFDGRKA